MTWDRLRLLGYITVFVLLGAVIFSLYGLFRTELEKSQFIGFGGGVLLGSLMVGFLLIIMIVPERRRTGWVEAITTVNAKYLFLGLIVLDVVASALMTPPDVISQMLLSLPMYVLYELGIVLLRIWPPSSD